MVDADGKHLGGEGQSRGWWGGFAAAAAAAAARAREGKTNRNQLY